MKPIPPKIEMFGDPSSNLKSEIEAVISQYVKEFKLDLEHQILEIYLISRNDIRQLNDKYRNIDKSTDVLSFPQGEGPHPVSIWGTIIISPDDARERGESVPDLVKHGLLHLSGYDHEADQDIWDKAALRINHSMGTRCKD